MKRALSLSVVLVALAAIAAPRAHASCATVIGVSQNGLQSAINAIPSTIGPGDYCLQLAGGVYNETISFPAYTYADSFSRIIISSSFGTSPVISNANASGALVTINASSVTFNGIFIQPNGATQFGVLVSSGLARVTGVKVLDPGGFFSGAAVEVDAADAVVSGSSFTAATGAAYAGSFTTNAARAAISQSTFSAAGTAPSAVDLAAASISLAGSYVEHRGGGDALRLLSAPGVQVLASSFSVTGGVTNPAIFINSSYGLSFATVDVQSAGLGLDLQASSAGVFTNMTVRSTGGDALIATTGSHDDLISLSTFTTASLGHAMELNNVSSITVSWSTLYSSGLYETLFAATAGGYNTIAHSSITTVSGGSIAAVRFDTPGNTLSDSFASSSFGAAVWLNGSSNNTILRSSLKSMTNVNGALYLGGASGNTISLSDMSNNAGDAVRIDANSTNNAISQSTMTSGGNSGGSALRLVNTVSSNTVSGSVLRQTGTGAPAVQFQNSAASNTITTSFLDSPSTTTVQLDAGTHNNAITFSTVTAGGTGSAAVMVYGSSMNVLDHDYLSDPTGDGARLLLSNYNQLTNSRLYSNQAATYAALRLAGASFNTFTSDFIQLGSGSAVTYKDSSNANTISQSTITTSLGGSAAVTFTLNSVGNTITQSYLAGYGLGGFGLFLNGGADNTTLSNSTVAVTQGSGSVAVTASVVNSTFTQLTLLAPNGYGIGFGNPSDGDVVSYSQIRGMQGVYINGGGNISIVADTATATGVGFAAVGIYASPAGSLTTITDAALTGSGPASALVYNAGAGTSLKLTGTDSFHGPVGVLTGSLTDGAATLVFGGDLTIGPSASVSVAQSTCEFYGSLETPVVTAQTLTVQAAAPPSLGFVDVKVASFSARGSAFTAGTFQDTVAASTVAFAAATSPAYSFGALTLKGAVGTNQRVVFRSLTPGAAMALGVSRSTVTLAMVLDSDASSGAVIQANDGSSVDGGGDTSWNFAPWLDVELPGENWVDGAGKSGAPNTQVAGPVPVTVRAISASSTTLYGSNITVSLAGGQPYDDSQTQPLVSGTTTFQLILRKAEPIPTSHTLTASSTQAWSGASWTDSVSVSPDPLAKLQLLLNGETADPGSTGSGKTGTPQSVVAGVPYSVTVRGVDQYFNLVPTSDQVQLSASGANLPQTQTLSSGSTLFSNVVFASSGTGRVLTVSDVSNGAVTASPSPSFTVFAPTASSPTVSVNIANNSVQTSLNGSISGTASDPSGVTQVSVQLVRGSDQKYYDWAASFTAAPVSSAAALGTPGGQSTTWTAGVADAALSVGASYYVTVRSINASGNAITAVSTFTFNPNYGQVGSLGDGEGAVTVAFQDQGGSPTSAGCQILIAAMTFTVGTHGIAAGGQIAVHLPDTWVSGTANGTVMPNPAQPGFLAVSSPVADKITFNPPAQSSASFVGNWFLYTAQAGLSSGQTVSFKYASFAPGGPQSVGPQPFTFLSQGDPTGLLKPIAAQPQASLDPGAAASLQFSNQQPLTLGPLQTSSTMQLLVKDACGSPTYTPASVTAFVGAFNSNGADSGALYYPAGGGAPISSLTLPANSSGTAKFYFQTSTPGPMYEQLTASATLPSGFTWATRYAQLLASPVGLSGVSVDTGTLQPGATSATLTPGSFAGAAVVNFSLSNPNVGWEVIISTDGVNYSPPLVDRYGYGQPGRSVSWYGLTETSWPQTLVKPGGPYYVKIRVGGGVVEDTSLRIFVAPSAFVYGTVKSTGAAAYVTAQGPNTSFANFAVASSTGYFEIYGLQNGARYNIVATTGSSINGQFVQLQTSSNNVTATTAGTNIGAFPFPTPTFLRLRVQLPQPSPFEFWGGFNAFSTTGQQAWGTLHYLQGADKSDDGSQSFGGSASTWTVVGVTPGTYNLQVNLPQVSVSSSLANVVIPPGTTTDLYLTLQRKANLYGWAVVPSSTQYGTWVSVQGTKAGDTRPSVFGGTYLQGWQYSVGQTSAVYSLFGLDPGSWTITAHGQGFGSSSTVVFISSSADLGDPVNGGVNLALSSGTVLNGVISISGDSSNLPNLQNGGVTVFVNAYNPQTYSNGFAQVFIATDAALARSTFSITGLDVGTYFVNAWIQGAQLQGPQPSTQVFASGGFLTLPFAVDSARAAITVRLPAFPPPDFHKVSVYYTAQSTTPALIQDFAALPGVVVGATSATWVSPPLSPGFLSATGDYGALGTFGNGYGQLIDGKTTPVDIDLRGSTYTVSGTVVIGGNVNLNVNGTAVSVSSVPGVLAQSTTNEYCLMGLPNAVSTPTFHLELLPITRQGNYLTQPLSNPGVRNAANNCAAPQSNGGGGNNDVDPFLAYVVAISTDGTFLIPNVPPGGYVLRVPTNLSSIYGYGPDELPPVRQLVTVTTSNVSGLTFNISQGVSVSGQLRLPAGLNLNRGMQVSLNDASGSPVRTAWVNFNQSNSAFYSLDRIPDGTYALLVQDGSLPRAYGARPVTIKVAGVSVSQDIQLTQLGIIKGKLAVQQFLPNSTTAQFLVIDAHNADQLPRNFQIYADANPWFQGGRSYADNNCGAAVGGAAGGGGGFCNPGYAPTFDDSGEFSLSGVLPGLYDVHFQSYNDPTSQSAIKVVSSMAPGVTVNGGATTDIGTYNLTSALSLRGTITDVTTSSPIANVPVMARPSLSQNHDVDSPRATTDGNGNYTLVGLDPAVKLYDIYANRREDSSGAAPPAYELKVAASVDATSATVQNFALTPAPYTVSGRVVGAASGPPLLIPFNNGDHNSGIAQLGAMIFFQKNGVQPHDNPISDVQVPSDPQGRFTIPSLTTGTYKLTAVALGYASYSQSVTVSTGSLTLPTITLTQGATLTGALRKPDGSNPSQNDIDVMVAVTNNFSQLLVATLTPDSNANTYTNYTISGFQPGVSYRVLIFPKGGSGSAIAPAEASNVVFSTTSVTNTLDVVVRPPAPYVFSKSKHVGSAYNVRFELSQPLRSRQPSDNDLTAILSTFSAAGTLSGISLDASRSILTAQYTPGVSESSFTLRLRGYSTQTDPNSLDPVNPQFVYDSTYSFFAGIDGYYANVLSNFNGGTLLIDDDPGRVAIPGGAFQIDASSSISIGLALSQEALTGAAASGLRGAAANIKAMRYGGSAYPPEIFRAMAATPQGISPFSGFYNILLPLGIRTSLQKPVPLTVNYSTGTDPTTLNLYWYNAAANAYVLQQDVTGAKPVIDTVNHTITINVNHFSTFVLFNTGVAVISGNTFSGDFTAYNFPNPFDLSVKTVTSIHGGGTPSIRGTMISVALPADVSGDGEIKIYNVAGEKVRTISLGTVSGGAYYYQPWDGRNDSGRDVASGVYIGQVKVGDHSKFFKMALIK